MTTTQRIRPVLATLLLACATSAAWSASGPSPAPFTATYQVLRDGDAIGEATITLKQAGTGEFDYRNAIKGTSGLAAMLGVSSDETTHFRWRNGMPETMTYDYTMDAAIKHKHRHLQVDWDKHAVTVEEGKGPIHYTSAPGMVDRNTMPLALGLALRAGSKSVTLPVGVKQRVEQQTYAVKGTESVKVPAGSFSAERVVRTDDDKAFDAWYVPKKYPLPVKIAQGDGGNLTLQLIRFNAN